MPSSPFRPSACTRFGILLFAGLLESASADGSADGSCRTCRALAEDRQQEATVSLLQRKGAALAEHAGGAAAVEAAGQAARHALAKFEPPAAAAATLGISGLDDRGPPTDPWSQAARLAAAKPIAWVHVPKCGSSLMNMLIHLPGMCPGIPDDLIIGPEAYGPTFLTKARQEYDVSDPNGPCPHAMTNWGNHVGAGDNWDSMYEGHSVLMMRQPEQRLISGWYNLHHSWDSLYWGREPRDMREYAEVISGCATRMITRGGDSASYDCGGLSVNPKTFEDIRPTDEEVALAVHRVHHGFVFVGIDEEWAISMCLAHRIFGGACRRSDFMDTRLGSSGAHSPGRALGIAEQVLMPEVKPYDTAPLRGFTDPYDNPVYEAAKERFAKDVERYGVSLSSCKPCFDEAGVKV